MRSYYAPCRSTRECIKDWIYNIIANVLVRARVSVVIFCAVRSSFLQPAPCRYSHYIRPFIHINRALKGKRLFKSIQLQFSVLFFLLRLLLLLLS